MINSNHEFQFGLNALSRLMRVTWPSSFQQGNTLLVWIIFKLWWESSNDT